MSRTARHSTAPLQSDPPGRQIELPAKRAPAVDAARRAFLRMVSHELRTPLNAIIGFSEILTRELYGPLGAPQYRDYAEHIRESGHRLLKLVNQVLEVARLDGGAADLTPAAEPLIHLLDDVADQLREDLRARSVALRIEDEERLPTVWADARAARGALFNLLHNAVTHGRQGGEVVVRVRSRTPFVDIDIADDGPGMAVADIAAMLAPFNRQEPLGQTARRAGLGLPIARMLAEAMGGELQLMTRPGSGLTARLTLPAG